MLMSNKEYTRTTSVDISKWFRQYTVNIGYDEKYGKISPISVIRKSDNITIKEWPFEGDIIRKALLTKRFEIWLNLFPDNLDSKLGTIKESYENKSQWLGFATFILLYPIIDYSFKYLWTLVGPEWASIIMGIPVFFWFLSLIHSKNWYMKYFLRKYCKKHGHLVQSFGLLRGEDSDIFICNLCNKFLVKGWVEKNRLSKNDDGGMKQNS